MGVAWVSARLHAGGTDVKGDWQEQLDQDVAPWLTGRQPVWLRADSAYSCKDLGSYCRQRGRDYSGSVTDPRQKAPLLRLADAMGLREDEGEPLDAAGQERALAEAHQPARRPEELVLLIASKGVSSECRQEYTCNPPLARRLAPVPELLAKTEKQLPGCREAVLRPCSARD